MSSLSIRSGAVVFKLAVHFGFSPDERIRTNIGPVVHLSFFRILNLLRYFGTYGMYTYKVFGPIFWTIWTNFLDQFFGPILFTNFLDLFFGQTF